MKTIIIHHVQECWNNGLDDRGTSYEQMLKKVTDHLSENKYDNVIVTNFETWELEDSQMPLYEYNPLVQNYDYGWCYDGLDLSDKAKHEIMDGKLHIDKYGDGWAEGRTHSEVVSVPDWLMNLRGDVYLCGAFDGECVEDMETAIQNTKLNLNRLNHLIV